MDSIEACIELCETDRLDGQPVVARMSQRIGDVRDRLGLGVHRGRPTDTERREPGERYTLGDLHHASSFRSRSGA